MKKILSFLKRKKFWAAFSIVLVVAVFLVWRSPTVQVIVENLTPPKLPALERIEKTKYLSQNWKPKEAQKFHHMAQGTATLPVPYHWLLALEQPERTPFGLLLPKRKALFTDPDYIGRYGFIRSTVSDANPDALPIGFAKSEFQNIAGYPTTTSAIGFTCAACHTGHLVHNNTEYVIEGGPAVTDLGQFSKGLGAALGQTLFSSKLSFLPNKRFDRFAHKVLGDTYSVTTKTQLAKDLESVLVAGAHASDVVDVVEGFGRLDALNRIGNQVFSLSTNISKNYAPISAPVNYPHLWTTGWFNWVQYDASIMQPLIRNSGEAMGVHAHINTTAPINEGRFSSSIPIENMVWIEKALAGKTNPMTEQKFGGLQAPQWPEALGKIDKALVKQGRKLYERKCKSCHLPPLNEKEIFDEKYFTPIKWYTADGLQETKDPYLKLNVIPETVIGTDTAQADILHHRTVDTTADIKTGRASMGINATICGAVGVSSYNDRAKKLVEVKIKDGPMLSFAMALGAVVQQVNEAWMDSNGIPEDQRANLEGNRPNCLQAGAGYKARPLNGIWATAPFLHNGSVPTLDDLLRPVDERPRFVQLGNPSFDPQKVGLKQPAKINGTQRGVYEKGYFILDTQKDGNRNTGHAFGATSDGDKTGVIGKALSDDERRAIIEYLKTL